MKIWGIAKADSAGDDGEKSRREYRCGKEREWKTVFFCDKTNKTALFVYTDQYLKCYQLALLSGAETAGNICKEQNEKVQKIFLSLYEVLRFAGMAAENDCLGDEFRKEAEKVCGEMEAQLKAAQQTALKAWYSGEDISPKEERELCRIYRTVCRTIAEKLMFREKILFYFTKCFL